MDNRIILMHGNRSILKRVIAGVIISLFYVFIFSLLIQGANAGTNSKFYLTIGTQGDYGLIVDSVTLSNPNPAPGQSITATVKWRATACPTCIVKANAFGDWNKQEIARFHDGSNTGGTNTFTFTAPSSSGNYNLRLIWAYDIGAFSNYDSTNLPSPSQASAWGNSASGILDVPFSVSVSSTPGQSADFLFITNLPEDQFANVYSNGNSFTKLKALVEGKGYKTAYIDLNKIRLTSDLLKDKKIVMLIGEYPLAWYSKRSIDANEISAISDFVNSGGGLFVTSNVDYNGITQQFGITLSGNNGGSTGLDWPLYNTAATYFESHPITEGISRITGDAGDRILASPPAKIIGYQNKGGEPLLAVSSKGAGKVIVWFGVGSFLDGIIPTNAYRSSIEEADNKKFIENSINWLSAITQVPVPSIKVTSPNGGETWKIGSTYDITWTSQNVPGNVEIRIDGSPGITKTIAYSAPNTGKYTWTIGNDVEARSDWKVVVTYYNPTGADVWDTSDNSFTITQVTDTTSPSLISPSNGATLDYTPTFKWNSVTGSNLYQWDLSERSDFASIAATWQTAQISISPAQVGTLTPGKTYYWRVAAFNSQNIKGLYSPAWSFTYSKIIGELTVKIISPLSKSKFTRNEQIYLNAEITGGKSPYQVIATSDKDGTLTSGSTTSSNFDYSSSGRLSIGTHIITFKVTDAEGKIASDSITIAIDEGPKPTTPLPTTPITTSTPIVLPTFTKKPLLSELEFEGPYPVLLQNEGTFYVYFGHAGDIQGPRAFALVVQKPLTKITDVTEKEIVKDERAEKAIQLVLFHEKAPLIKQLLHESDPQVDKVASLTQGVVGGLVASAFGLIDGSTYAAQFWLGKKIDVPFEMIIKYVTTVISLNAQSAAIDSSVNYAGSIVTMKDTEIWQDTIIDMNKEIFSNTLATLVGVSKMEEWEKDIGKGIISAIYANAVKSTGLDVIDVTKVDLEKLNLNDLEKAIKASKSNIGFSAFRGLVDKLTGGFDTFVMMTRLSAASLAGRQNLDDKYSSFRIPAIAESNENQIATAESFYSYYLSLMHDFYEKNYLKEDNIFYFKDTSHAAIYELRSINTLSKVYFEAGKDFVDKFSIRFNPSKSYKFTMPENPIIAKGSQVVILRYYLPENIKSNSEASFFAVVYYPFYANGIPFQSGAPLNSKLGVSIRDNQGRIFDHISLDEGTTVVIPTGQESTVKARILTSATEGSYDLAAAIWDENWNSQYSSTNWERSKIKIQKSTFVDKAYQTIKDLIEQIIGKIS